MPKPSLPEILSNALTLVNQQLLAFTTDTEFNDKLTLTFGNAINSQFYQQLWHSPDFNLASVIEIRSQSELNGANGAFSRDTGKIYLAEEYLQQQFPPSQEGLGGLILEEYGHLIDAEVNPIESLGDEGAIFARLVQGKNITAQELQALQTENDTGIIDINGEAIAVEMAQGTTNKPPLLATPIARQSFSQNKAFSFTVPNYTFADAGDSLAYSATLGDGSALPSWLSFNPNTRTFSGTSTQAGNINLKVIATDSAANQVSDTFSVSILTANYSFSGGYTHGLTIVDDYVYVASGWGGLKIFQKSNDNTLTLAGSYDTSGYARDVFVTGNYAYVADSDSGLQILDISNSNKPTLISSYNTSGNAYGVFVVGNYAYVADWGAGLQILDISTAPENLDKLGHQ